MQLEPGRFWRKARFYSSENYLFKKIGKVSFVLVFLIFLFIYTYTRVNIASATTSSTLNFQGRLLNSSGGIVADGYYNLRFKLYDGGTSGGGAGTGESNAGTLLWTDSRYDQNGATAGLDYRIRVVNGYFSVNLGDANNGGTAFPSTINWDQELWLTMDVGGVTQTATPTYDGEMLATGNKRTKLTAVPYAFKAESANSVTTNNTSSASTNSSSITIQSGNASGTTSNSGNITIDVGTATSTAGTISIGTANTTGITIGRSSGTQTTTIQAGTTLALNSTTATSLTSGTSTTITSGSGNITLQAQGASTIGIVQIGVGGAGSTTPDFFALDVKSTTGDPAGGAEGYMYYNTFDNKFRCYQGSAWTDCISAASATTLQTAYNASTNPEITVDATRGALTVRDASTPIGANLFEVQDSSGATTYLATSATGTTIVGNLTQSTGTVSLTANGASSFTTSSGALTLTSAVATTWSTTAGNLTIQGGSGTVSLGSSTTLTASAGLTVSSGGAGALTLDSASNTLILAGTDTTLQRTASGTTTIDLVDGSATTLSLNNTGAGIASFSLAEAGSYTGAGAVTLSSGTASTLTIDSGTTGTINIGTDASAESINLGTTGAAVKTVTVGNTNTTSTTRIQAGSGGIVLGSSAGQGSLTNNGSTINTTLALGDLAAGSIGTAATTVDIYTSFSIAPTASGRTYTLPTPTASTTYGRIIYISNIGTSGSSFTIGGNIINPGGSATYIWSNTNTTASWQYAGADPSTDIQNQNSSDQTANFRISGTGRANTSFTTPLVDSISGALSVGTSTATGVTIGGTTNTTSVLLQGAAGATYTVGTSNNTGGITIGNSTATNTIAIGSSAGASATQTINIGTSSTGSSTTTVNIGSTVAGVTTLQSQGGVKVSTLGSSTANSSALCRDSSTKLLTSCDATNTTGKPFLQGGNAFGALANLGTSDSNALQFMTNGTGRLYFEASSNSAYFGNASASGGTNATPNAFTIAATGSSTAGTAGANLSIQGGAGTSTTTGSGGGNLSLYGGNAGGSGNNNGGNLYLSGGNATGSGTAGKVIVQPTTNSTSAFQIQNSAGTSNLFMVDTTNSRVSIGALSSSTETLQVWGNAYIDTGIGTSGNITTYGNTTTVAYLKQQILGSSGSLAVNDVVILYNDGSGNHRAGPTTTARDPRVYGVAQSAQSTAGSGVNVAISGNFQVSADTVAVTVGDQLVTSSTSGKATVDNNATTGIIGIATTAKAGGSSGLVGVMIRPVNGQSSPIFRNGSDSTTALRIQNASAGTDIFVADTTNSRIYIGSQTTDTTGALLVLDTKTSAGDPTGINGAMYYNSNANKMRCYENGAWKDCDTAGTLQSVYDADTDGSDTVISLTSADDSIIFRNPASGGTDSTYVTTIDQLSTGATGGLDIQSAGTGNLLRVRDTTATATDVLTIADGGATTFQNQTNSTSAFKIQNASATTLLVADTTNLRVQIGSATADGTAVLLVLDTKNTSGDPTGVDGAMYYNSSSKSFRCYGNGTWKYCGGLDPRNEFYAFTDLGSVGSGEDFFYVTTGGSRGASSGIAGHPTVVDFGLGGTGASQTWYGTQVYDGILLGNNDIYSFESVFRLSALSSGATLYTARSGFLDTNNGESTDGCFIRYTDTVNSGKWQGVCRSNNTESTCDTGLTVAATTWYRVNIDINGAGTSATFAVNDTSSCSITTNIPTASGRGTGYGNLIVKTAGSGTQTMSVDYTQVVGQLNASR